MKASSTIKLHVLLLIVAFGLTTSCREKSTPQIEIQKGLKDYTNIAIGGGVDINQVLSDDKLRDIVIKDFSSLTSTNHMKMYSIAKKAGYMDWTSADTLQAFCERNDKRLFGHALVWHLGLPRWISDQTKENGDQWARGFLKNYIGQVVGRYKGKVAAWDVVNEAFQSQGGEYRKTFWYDSFDGPSYIAEAFRWAHEADPDAELFYNDFNTERDTAKLHGMIRMVEDLLGQGVPITGIGFQMHLRMDIPDETIAYCLQKAADTGLKIHISELDIIFNKHNDNKGGGQQIVTELTEELRAAQAEKYKNLVLMYRQIVPKDQQYGITFWDFTDRDSWIKGFFKLDDWPTIYDENLEPKPAYRGFSEGLTQPL